MCIRDRHSKFQRATVYLAGPRPPTQEFHHVVRSEALDHARFPPNDWSRPSLHHPIRKLRGPPGRPRPPEKANRLRAEASRLQERLVKGAREARKGSGGRRSPCSAAPDGGLQRVQ
eukprot:3269623-Alexandrium_andersonii.AAC.1